MLLLKIKCSIKYTLQLCLKLFSKFGNLQVVSICESNI